MLLEKRKRKPFYLLLLFFLVDHINVTARPHSVSSISVDRTIFIRYSMHHPLTPHVPGQRRPGRQTCRWSE